MNDYQFSTRVQLEKNANLSKSGNGKSIVCCFTDFVLTARICQEDII